MFTQGIKNISAKVLQSVGLSGPNRAGVCPWRILMYHRVIDPTQSAAPLQSGMFVRPETFKMQMDYLSKRCNVVALDSLIEKIQQGEEIRQGTVAITFDDGWVDNYINAYPILKKLGLSATIFLPTEYVGTSKLFWTDVVGMAVQAIAQGQTVEESFAKAQVTKDDYDRILLELFHGIALVNEEKSVEFCLEQLLKMLKDYEPQQRKMLLEVLGRGFSDQLALAGRMFLNWAEISEMSDCVAFGSHGHTHQNLTQLTVDETAWDVAQSLELLKLKEVNISKVFCYPGGYYNQQTQEALRMKGINSAVVVSRETQLSEVPTLYGRVGIHEDISHTEARFAARIWFGKPF